MMKSKILFTLLILNGFIVSSNKCETEETRTGLLFIQSLVEKQQKIPESMNMDVFVRVLRGKTPEHFETLSDSQSRRVVMVTDMSGLRSISGLSKSQMLEKIGYTSEYVRDLRKSGTEFKMLVFAKKGSRRRADWKGLGQLLGEIYGEKATNLLNKYESQLRRYSFERIQYEGGKSFKEAYDAGEGSPNYITFDRLSENATLWEFRSFLYNELRLSELYAGDGFTRLEDGTVGLPEYFYINEPISNLNSYVIVNL